MKKYVNLSALSTFLDNLKNIFSPLIHTHTQSEITDLIIDDEVSSSPNLVRNNAVNSALTSVKEELSDAITTKAADLIISYVQRKLNLITQRLRAGAGPVKGPAPAH